LEISKFEIFKDGCLKVGCFNFKSHLKVDYLKFYISISDVSKSHFKVECKLNILKTDVSKMDISNFNFSKFNIPKLDVSKLNIKVELLKVGYFKVEYS
jgi:hypothetical protein